MATLSVRFDPEVLDLIDGAARRAKQSRSIWAREVLVAAATGGQVQPHPERALALQGVPQGQVVRVGCQHPVVARVRQGFIERCGVCDEVTKGL